MRASPLSVSRSRALFALLIALATPGLAASAQGGVFTIISNNPSSVFTTVLTPGTWTVGPTDGAWNAWGSTSGGCDVNGANCTDTGWLTRFYYSEDGGAWVIAGDLGIYQTPELALANADAPITFTIASETVLGLSIQDSRYDDNSGTLTITVQETNSTPEPSTLVLIGSGLLGTIGVARRRR